MPLVAIALIDMAVKKVQRKHMHIMTSLNEACCTDNPGEVQEDDPSPGCSGRWTQFGVVQEECFQVFLVEK